MDLSTNGKFSLILKKQKETRTELQEVLDAPLKHLLSQISPKPGPRPKATSKGMIHFLVSIFFEGTGKIPQCTHKRHTVKKNQFDHKMPYLNPPEYKGEVYDFILAVKPLMKRLGIDLESDKTIGKYIIEAIKERSFMVLKHVKRIDPLPKPYKQHAQWSGKPSG